MLPHHTSLKSFLQNKTKAELIKIIKDTYQLTHGKMAWELFGGLVYDFQLKNLDAVALRQNVAKFHNDSLQGKYYAPFVWDSKNFMEIPKETDVWFSQLSLLLDLTCELVSRKEVSAAKYCFKKLFDLIERMENGEEIVFAHECGDWMITCRHNYKNMNHQLKDAII